MPDKPSIDIISKIVPDRYKLVVAAAQRARALNFGQKPLLDTKLKNNALIALEEIARGKVKVATKAVVEEEEKAPKKAS